MSVCIDASSQSFQLYTTGVYYNPSCSSFVRMNVQRKTDNDEFCACYFACSSSSLPLFLFRLLFLLSNSLLFTLLLFSFYVYVSVSVSSSCALPFLSSFSFFSFAFSFSCLYLPLGIGSLCNCCWLWNWVFERFWLLACEEFVGKSVGSEWLYLDEPKQKQ